MSCPDQSAKNACRLNGSSGAPPAGEGRDLRLEYDLEDDQEVMRAVLHGDLDAASASRLTGGRLEAELFQAEADLRRLRPMLQEWVGVGEFPDERDWVRVLTGARQVDLRKADKDRLDRLRYARMYGLVRAFLDGRMDERAFRRVVDYSYAGAKLGHWLAKRAYTIPKQQYFTIQTEIAHRSKDELIDQHLRSVHAALKSGQPVPAEVLADYPHLPDLAGLPVTQLIPDEQLGLLRWALVYPSPDAFLEAILDRVRPPYELLRQLSLTNPNWVRDDLSAEAASQMKAALRWACGLPAGGWGGDLLEDEARRAAQALYGFAVRPPQNVTDSRDLPAVIGLCLPQKLHRVLTSLRSPGGDVIYSPSMGVLGRSEMNALAAKLIGPEDEPLVRNLLEAGLNVPEQVTLRFPTLLAEFGL